MKIFGFPLFVFFGLFVTVCLGDLPNDSIQNVTTVEPTTSNSTTTSSSLTTTLPPSTTTSSTNPTTTNAPQTTTVAPIPTGPIIVSGNLTQNNYTCLKFEFTTLFKVSYNTEDNKTEVATFCLPKNSSLNYDPSTCSNKEESFKLVFPNGTADLDLTFKQNDNFVMLDSIVFNIYQPKTFLPNIYNNESKITFNLTNFSPNFKVDKSHSFVCANNLTIHTDEVPNFSILFSNLKLQAFMQESQKGNFSDEHNCLNEINDVVPIAVGAALTGLVIIVLIAYFIGRRRNRRLAYQSV